MKIRGSYHGVRIKAWVGIQNTGDLDYSFDIVKVFANKAKAERWQAKGDSSYRPRRIEKRTFVSVPKKYRTA